MSNELIREFHKDNMKEDLIAKGFHKLDENLVDRKAPKIDWGEKFKASSLNDQIEYLKKLCATMNHAAFLIQNERNELLVINGKQEERIIQAKKDMDENLTTLNSEISKMNMYKQDVNKSIAKKNTEITDLKKEVRILKNGA